MQNSFSNALKVATGLELGYLGPLRLCEAVNILAAHRLYLKRVTGHESKMVGPLVAMSSSHFKGFARGEEHLDELRGISGSSVSRGTDAFQVQEGGDIGVPVVESINTFRANLRKLERSEDSKASLQTHLPT